MEGGGRALEERVPGWDDSCMTFSSPSFQWVSLTASWLYSIQIQFFFSIEIEALESYHRSKAAGRRGGASHLPPLGRFALPRPVPLARLSADRSRQRQRSTTPTD